MKLDWSKIVFAIVLIFIAWKVTQPLGLSKSDKEEIKAIQKELTIIKDSIRNIRNDKSQHYDTIIKLYQADFKLKKSIENLNKRYEKLRSTPITNAIGDSLARAIIEKSIK